MSASAPSSSSSSNAPHAAASPPKNCVLSHWTKSTPEEGIQVIFNAAEVLHGRQHGVQMATHPPTAERPCRWEMNLRLAHPPQTPPFPALDSRSQPHPQPPHLPSILHPPSCSAPEAPFTASTTSSSPSDCVPSSTLLILTLDRVLQHDMGTGTGIYMEDPKGASQTRCGAYRTLYIYSPKLKRDICVHSIKREFWPQYVMFDGMDVKENNGQEYHFQIWLAGASPRQMDARTSVRLTQCQRLLWAMRKDIATTDVEIVIKDTSSTTATTAITTQGRGEKNAEDHLGTGCKGRSSETLQQHRQASCESDSQTSASADKDSRGCPRSRESNQGDHRSDNDNSGKGVAVFRAHKCILESIAFFDRMLNSDFKEAQADEYGRYTIQLSNEMFDAEIMGLLLDYLYTREPISAEPPLSSSSPDTSSCSPHHSFGTCPNLGSSYDPEVRHALSANVGLGLETIIAETGYPPGLHRHRSHHQCLLPTTGLTLWHWGAIYRAALHLEDKELQTTTLQQIQARLDPETTLEQILKWGYQHEEVKAVMLEYLIKERREVFGDEERNKLRPYLWAEFEEQVETLVEITSQIAMQ